VGRNIRWLLITGLLLLGIFPLTALLAQDEGGLIPELKLFSKALSAICEAYPGDVAARNLFYEAVKGMMSSLDDFSEFIDPERYKLLEIHMRGEYAGIGAILQIVQERVTVRAVEPGKPAEQAGLRAGDVILKVDGISVEKKSVAEVSALLRGTENTPVVLTVLREPAVEPFDLTVQRQKIQIPAIQDARMIGKHLAYFRLTAWQDHTIEQVDQTLKDFKENGMKALIIDLRNNDGGLLPQAVALAERFLTQGKKIVSVQSKIQEQKKEYFVAGDGEYAEIELVVLVNEKSASASEVFSAAMQDHRRAVIVGVKTFGKGSVQSVIPLDDVSGMKLTTARYLTPSGRMIDKIGLTPDRVVVNGPEGVPGMDHQTLEAIAVLKNYM